MANIIYTIALSSKQADAGPYYDIYYSTDCSTYIIATGGDNVYLPSVGSSINLSIPDTTLCIKLVNKSPLCNNNSVVSIVNTTTTTSTTSTSTTTTTTLSPCPPLLSSSLYALFTPEGYNSTYNTWTDNIHGVVASVNGQLTASACGGWTFDGTNNYVTFPATSIFNDNRLIMWAYLEVPTGSTNRAIFGHPYNIEGSNGWDLLFTGNGGLITYRPGGYGPDNSKTISTGIGSYGMYAAVAYATNSYALYENGSQIGTTSNLVSVNTNGGNFYFGYNQNVDASPYKGTVRAFGLSLGLPTIPTNATIASASACITGSQSPSPCTTTTTSTTTTTTSTSTTTTTTAGPFYDIVCYGNNADDACYNPISCFSMAGNGTTFCNSTTFTSTGWYPIATGNYVLSYGGNAINVSHTQFTNTATVYGGGCQACPATTTTTTTTTQGYDYYDADYYDCTNCGAGPVGTILVAFPAGQVVTLNRFYQPIGGPDGLAYRVTGTASPGTAYILTNAFGSTTTCALACIV